MPPTNWWQGSFRQRSSVAEFAANYSNAFKNFTRLIFGTKLAPWPARGTRMTHIFSDSAARTYEHTFLSHFTPGNYARSLRFTSPFIKYTNPSFFLNSLPFYTKIFTYKICSTSSWFLFSPWYTQHIFAIHIFAIYWYSTPICRSINTSVNAELKKIATLDACDMHVIGAF